MRFEVRNVNASQAFQLKSLHDPFQFSMVQNCKTRYAKFYTFLLEIDIKKLFF